MENLTDKIYIKSVEDLSIKGDLNRITEDLALSEVLSSGLTVRWSSSNSAYVTSEGKVTRPTIYTGNQDVVLTASIYMGSALFDTKEFELTILCEGADNAQTMVERDLESLTVTGISSTVTENLDLPTEGLFFGSEITWSSSNRSVLNVTDTKGVGKVIRPSGDNAKVLLTAVGSIEVANADGTMDKAKASRVFEVTVRGKGSSSSSSSGGGTSGGTSSGLGLIYGGSGEATPTPAPTSSPGTEILNPNLEDGVFVDLGGYEWASESILMLNEKGIIKGVGDREFAPGNNVTREQFVTMMARAVALDAEEAENIFIDVDESDYYADAVMAFQSLGIVSGQDESTFGVGSHITRQDMAVMCYRLARYLGISTEADGDGVSFVDGDDISDYAREAVEISQKLGLVSGDDRGNFNPLNTATRAESAKIIANLMELM